MKFESTEVWGFKHALRGMRNPMNSWDRADSSIDTEFKGQVKIGEEDLKLAQKLIKSGSEHRKFMRQIFVSVDITAPLYWWKEFDTYKVGTVANSCSTMHKLASTPITEDCFEMDDFQPLDGVGYMLKPPTSTRYYWHYTVSYMELMRQRYNETKDFRYWKELIRILPESWLQKRTVTMDYENLLCICSKGQRRNHKLTEWSDGFIYWARTLPHAQDLIFMDEVADEL